MSPDHASLRPFVLSLLALLVAAAAPAQVPADAVFQGFQPTGELQVEIDGELQPKAELLISERAQAYLLMTIKLPSPVLVELRGGRVSKVHLMKVVRRDDGSADILADADLRPVGRYRIEGTSVAFEVDGKHVVLKEKPPLLGMVNRSQLIDYEPGYGVSARSYAPDAEAMAALRSQAKSDVRVRVYFGSWCPHCRRHVPYILRVEKDLEEAGSPIAFEYVGLPRYDPKKPDLWPEGVKGVPTAVVYAGGREIGRIENNQWNAPEVALSQLLSSGS